MNSHQYYIDWFKQFDITVLPKERDKIKENFLSGNACNKLDHCVFLHMLAALLANKRNPQLIDDKWNENDPRLMLSHEWEHLIELVNAWSN